MALYYEIRYQDNNGDEIRVLFKELLGSGQPVSVKGRFDLSYPDIKDPTDLFRVSTGTLSLEASTTEDFADLFSETERRWNIYVYRNGATIWSGWINPDGIYEDYVRDKWIITLECTDGLGYLEKLSYVDNSGLPYTGQASLREVMLQAIRRTGLNLNVAFVQDGSWRFPLRYVINVTLQNGIDYFEQQIDQATFYSEDGRTIMSCKEVIEYVLTPVNAFICQHENKWFIMRNLTFAGPLGAEPMQFEEYLLFNPAASTQYTRDLNITLGSEINGFFPHHAEANQRKERKMSIGAVRAEYEYGDASSINENGELENDGATIAGWTVNFPAAITLDPTGLVQIDNTGVGTVTMTSDTSVNNVSLGNIVKINLQGFTDDPPPQRSLDFSIGVVLDDTTPYYLNEFKEWTTATNEGPGSTSPTRYRFFVNDLPGSFNLEIETPPVPVETPVYIQLFSPQNVLGATALTVYLEAVELSTRNENPPQGEEHTAERTASPSTITVGPLKSIMSAAGEVAYKSSLFMSNGTSKPLLGYRREISATEVELLRATVEDILILQSKPSIVFSGSIYGYMPYLSRVQIDGITGIFMVTGYEYDTASGITRLVLYQVHYDPSVLSDITYEKVIQYGNVVEPTIKG